MEKHQVKVPSVTSIHTDSPIGKIFIDEYEALLNYLYTQGKQWEDINKKTITYICGDRVPYKLGQGKFLKGRNDVPGYLVTFRFHGEVVKKTEPKPNQKYGKKPK